MTDTDGRIAAAEHARDEAIAERDRMRETVRDALGMRNVWHEFIIRGTVRDRIKARHPELFEKGGE